MILAGDVGGTKVHCALYDFADGRLQHIRDEKFPAPDYDGLASVVRAFLGADKVAPDQITAACFGVPGPVRGGKLRLTNLPWELDQRALGMELGIEHLFLINDLEANGYGIPELTPDQICTIHEGDTSIVGNRALVSAGTGLGEAILAWNGRAHIPMPSEGGHTDFAPRNEEEIALLRYLQKQLNGRVSYERVVSGIGLKNIYSFLRDDQGLRESAELRGRIEQEDPNAVITELDRKDELCTRTLDIFVSSYGAEAGNMGLKALSVGGMFLGGGIAPRITHRFEDGRFVQAFTDKGRLSNVLEAMPVHIILESRAALMGAAAFAEARAALISGRSSRAASRAH